MNFEFDYFPLFIIAAFAWLIPLILGQIKSFKIPSVIVEIIVGIFIGKNFLNLIPDAQYLDFLTTTGFIFLMFLSGLEIDIDQIRASLPRKKITPKRIYTNPFLVGLIIFLLTLILAVLGAYGLSYFIPVNNIWFFALILSTSSVGIIFPVLKDRGETYKRYGQMIILSAAVADIVSIMLFTFTSSYLNNDGIKLEVFLIFTLFILFYLAFKVGKKIIKAPVFNRIINQLSHAASQIKVRGTILLILLFIILSQLIDAEMILGSFLAGLLLSNFLSKDRSILLVKLDGMGYGFFIPVFFILVGVHLDIGALHTLNDSILFLMILLITLYLVKIIPALIWTKLFGLKKSIAAGILLSSRLSLIIAAAQIALQLELISPAINSAFIIMAIITCLASPIIFNLLNKFEKISKNKIIIVGGGEIGNILAKRLKMHGQPIVSVQSNVQNSLQVSKKGFHTIHANPADKQVYKDIGLMPYNYVIVLENSSEKNYQISQMLQNEFAHEKIIANPLNDKNIKRWQGLNMEEVLDIDNIIATAIENLVFRPNTYHALFESFESFIVEDITISNPNIDGKRVKEIAFNQNGSLMLIRRGENSSIPHGDSTFRIGDVVTVLGSELALDDFRNKFT